MSTKVWESDYLDVYDFVMMHSPKYHAVMRAHVKSLRGCKKVLEYGCGTGNVVQALVTAKHDVTGVDTSFKAIQLTKMKVKKAKAKRIQTTRLPFKAESFDGVSSMFVIYFTPNPRTYLRETFRVLKKGGKFVVSFRVTRKGMKKILKHYEGSLTARGLLPRHHQKFTIFKDHFEKQIIRSVTHPITPPKMKKLLSEVGFSHIRMKPTPYFGQLYTATAVKVD